MQVLKLFLVGCLLQMKGPVLAVVDAGQDEEVDELADGEHRRAQQQAQEAAHLAKQTEELERHLLLDLLIAQLLVEDVDLYEILPETGV